MWITMREVNVSLPEVKLELGYTGSRFDLIKEFYVPCLNNAVGYDRSVGYFRSSTFALTGVAFSRFAQRGGKIRLICSPELDEADVEAIEAGLKSQETVRTALGQELKEILKYPEFRPAVGFLATLVAAEVLEIRIAFREARGMFHDKLGIFRDPEGQEVSFIGTVNETFTGWSREGNHENFEVFQSWIEGDSQRLRRHKEYFDSVWENRESGISTMGFPDGARERLREYVDPKGIDTAAKRLRDVIIEEVPTVTGGAYDEVENEGGYTLQPHQEATVDAWTEQGFRGIIKHATGAGKTVTALEAVRRWIKEGRCALVLVPSVLLAEQWIEEAKFHLAELDAAFLEAGGEGKKAVWSRSLAEFTSEDADLGPRVVIATVQTAATDDFLRLVRGGRHLLLVADEVHRLGASTFQEIFILDAAGRLGLSATPERFGDPDGTNAIFSYFGPIVEPIITLRDAIAAGRLVPYDYFIHSVSLTPEEQQEWDELTQSIRRAYAQLPETSDGEKQQSERFKHLLIKRSRIVKQASAKVRLAVHVIEAHYKANERWLIYCDDQEQLRKVKKSLESTFRSDIAVMEYHSRMKGSRSATMEYFRQFSGIMVAIKCLDEGVDIPTVDAALILASSANPREFIQRRGRVLRQAKEKYSASVHDALVNPNFNVSEVNALSLIATEIRRASKFAQDARNRSASVELRALTRELGLDPHELDLPEVAFEGEG